MDLSKIDGLDTFLAGTHVQAEVPERPYILLNVPGRDNVPGAPELGSQLYLAYPELKLKLDSVLQVIVNTLEKSGHPADRDVAIAVLGLTVESRDPETPPVDHLAASMRNLRGASLRQAVVFPGHTPHRDGYRIELGSIVFQRFDPSVLLMLANRGGSEFAEDLTSMTGSFSIQMHPVNTHALDWWHGPWPSALAAQWSEPDRSNLLDAYYHSAWRVHYLRIPDRASDEALILEASAFIGGQMEEILRAMLSVSIGLYAWVQADGRKRSWAMLAARGIMHLNMPSEPTYRECRRWLRDLFDFRRLELDAPLAASIRSFARFLQRAHRHRLERRYDEAFLHFVIALDLLLGENTQSAETIAKRAATLIFGSLDKPLDRVERRIRKHYGLRSKYVHEGTPVDKETMHDIEEICLQVLWALLAASSIGRYTDVHEWREELGTLYVLCASPTRTVPDDEMRAVGAWVDGPKRVGPNYVSHSGQASGDLRPMELWEARRD